MKKWIRRILLLTATTLVVLLGGAMLAVFLARAKPSFYEISTLTDQQRSDAASSAEAKIIQMQNQAARMAAQSVVSSRAAASGRPTSLPAGFDQPVTLVFTAAEINSFFEKWSKLHNWKSVYEPYMVDPVIVLRDHRLIFAAKMRDPELVISLHFDAAINEQGQLDLQLARVLGGRLPLPESLLGKYEQQVASHVSGEIEQWQRSAKINASGVANASAISASMGKLFAHMLRHEPAEPVLFLPVVDLPGSVAVKILAVKIEDDSIALTVRPMTHDEQVALLNRIRENDPAVADIQSNR